MSAGRTASRCARALAGCALLAAAGAQAQGYPERPVRVVVASAAGGNADIVGRLVTAAVGQRLDQQFIVDNRAGAAGLIGSEIVARASADGYTLLHAASNYVIVAVLQPKPPYDPVKSFAPIGLVSTTALVLVIPPALPAKTVKELVAIGRARPGELSFASAGTGSPGHLAGALFVAATGVKAVHVPYKATQQAMIDLSAGQVQLMFPTLSAVMPQVNAGRLRALAITARERSALAPALPTLNEAGLPGYEASIWNGWVAPARTPPAILKRLSAQLEQVVQSPEVRDRMIAAGAEPLTSTPEAFGRLIAEEVAKWGKVIREAGIRPE